ncbi:RING-type E3 ubiquitin transferase [Citrus sinensis]|uniref:RING-type E3 ubiquitin transferase n=1 Tax=Citrus sinensis TaxID=2711 RepID=A0A067DVQ6_CITSI|nr:E3 ubiquitin-protein ligase SIRP1 [Citrus sinensis]KAH9728354.1 RING-type E3 ubiquitin transferase [Citrus sinensis]KDO43107.1 hypothetical protein CISIN_1g043965mg [Citrus sinensis]GAY39878.1 hypothetical protein CUMW_047760 [Citrus unshiu]
MGDAMVGYWCYICSQMVNPRMEAGIKCPFCESGIVEQMSSSIAGDSINDGIHVRSDRALSLWASILLRMMTGLSPSRPRIAAHEHFNNANPRVEEAEQEREFESLLTRRMRRNSSASLSRMLQDIRFGITSRSDGPEALRERSGSLILVNPMNEEALIIQDHNTTSSLGEYLVGPGLDLLLQHLLENDPNRYGCPAANKAVLKALPTVTIDKNLQCAVCLEEFEIGNEAKEMPCKHKFHGECIMPWLEVRSSCPVCRFQVPSDDFKIQGNGSGNRDESLGNEDAQNNLRLGNGEDRVGNGRRYWIPIPWPFDSLFSMSGSQEGGTSNSESSSVGTAAHIDET